MKVLEYLNKHGLSKLEEEFGIKVRQNDLYPDLYVLNYCQIHSSKFKAHPIVRECRHLVLEYTDSKWRLVSQSFDRFFNLGELDEEHDVTEMTAYEKVDGSLVNVFYYQGEWLYRTKSMIMPPSDLIINGIGDKTWKELIEQTIINRIPQTELTKEFTYMFEVVARENRVVTKYEQDQAYLLSIRNNITGDYVHEDSYPDVEKYGIRLPQKFKFKTFKDCVNASEALPNLEEGYVLYNSLGIPTIKVKSPAYVAAHRLRGECTPTPRRIFDMIWENEYDEYLTIFPEDRYLFDPAIETWNNMWHDMESKYDSIKHLESQKEFALAVGRTPAQMLIFKKRKTPEKTFEAIAREQLQSQIFKIWLQYSEQ
jgi:T4 RnlA family RNA ligase